MILTCPQCTAKYRLTASQLAPEGHRVRCSDCGEVWFQLPDPDELAPEEHSFEEHLRDDIEIDFQEIPESVKPIRERDPLAIGGGVVLPKAPGETKKKSRMPGAVAGYLAALVLFVGVFAGLTVMRGDIVQKWLPASLFYETVGLEVSLPGEGLTFADITARAAPSEDGNGEFIEVAGRILNSTSEDVQLLPVEATLRDREGKAVETFIIEIPEKTVPARNAISFAVSRQSNKKPGDVRLVFVLKTGEGVADNTQAPPLDDQTPPHASE